MNIAKYIDHTILKAGATKKEIKMACMEAKKYGFFSVCVNGANVSYAYDYLNRAGIKVATVVGFPLGAMATEVKAFEARNAIKNGAEEIDMVINIGALKEKKYRKVLDDIKAVRCHCKKSSYG